MRFLSAALAGFLLLGVSAARAEIVINVDQGASQPVPIAIPTFSGPPAAA
ncbi:MAG: hypothetical protein JOZ27_01620, partial [Caulobacteraceae bacterium]|nr:hypothetical protein [Caulobacteraceae bacterium]